MDQVGPRWERFDGHAVLGQLDVHCACSLVDLLPQPEAPGRSPDRNEMHPTEGGAADSGEETLRDVERNVAVDDGVDVAAENAGVLGRAVEVFELSPLVEQFLLEQ